MDFPVCPACKQSVIDDEAVDCPFCGASMKAKPGTKAVAAVSKPAASPSPETTSTKPALGKPTPGKPASGQPTLPGDDFPFDVELTSGKAAIQAMPNPTKQRSFKVICKMCDTPGYLPQNAAGQEVRCANPKCVMPVFTAPAPPKVEVAPPPPPPKSSNLPFIAGATILLMGTVLGGIYFVFSMPGRTGGGGKVVDEDAKQMMLEAMGGGKKPAPAGADKKEVPAAQNKEAVAGVPEAKVIDKEALIKSALSQMKESSLVKSGSQRKPYCRQLAAEACAVTGQLAAFRDHLEQLSKVSEQSSTYFRITPLLELFWVDFAKGDKKASTNSLTEAMVEVPKLVKLHGRTRLEIAGRVMAALVAAGQQDEALKMLSDFQASDFDAQMAARLEIAMDGRVFPLSDRDSILPWKYPLAVAVTASLINRGQMDMALNWASSQSTDDAKAECLSYWAEQLAFSKANAGSVDAGGAIAAAVSSLPAALASRVWSRAGCGRMQAQDEPGVLAAIKLAQSKLDEIKKPVECKMPSVKQTIDFKVPVAGPLLQAATAAGELANLQLQLAATKPDAESSLDLALAFLDATAPSLAVAHQRQEEAKNMGPAGLQKMLKDELKKKNEDEARTAANSYNRSLKDITEAAQQRFDIETQILSRLREGMELKVWIIVNARTTATDINKKDNFFATSLPGELREGLKGTAEEQAILGAWNVTHPNSEPPPPVWIEFNRRLETNIPGAVEYLAKAETKANQRDEIKLMAVSKLTMENKLATAFALIGKLPDGNLRDLIDRENCDRFVASLASQKGQAEEVWNQVAKVVHPTEKVALCRGLIAGLLSTNKPK